MNLLEISAQYRASLLSRNIYSESSGYSAQGGSDSLGLGAFLAFGFPPSYFSTSAAFGPSIYSVADSALRRSVSRRVSDEALDEIIPSSISLNRLFNGGPFALRSDDFSITRKQRVLSFVERASGLNASITPFTDYDYYRSDLIDDKLFEFSGTVQRRQLQSLVGRNIFSSRTSASIGDEFWDATSLSAYYLEHRLSENPSYFSDYILLAPDLDTLRDGRGRLDGVLKDGESGIASVLANGSADEYLVELGEFGRTGQKFYAGDCTGAGYNADTTYDINGSYSTDDPGERIIWGATTEQQMSERFVAERGLLRFMAKAVASSETAASAADQTKTCFTRNGEVIYKANPCRSWTVQDRYGDGNGTLIRGYGNGKENSVLRDFAIPKIHPTLDEDSLLPDPTNLMFSFENLAYTKQDLVEYNIPRCEWGPRYGRMLWYPPYIKSLSENINTNYDESKFVGRTESLYTYSNTVRTFDITFSLIMDYPFHMDETRPEDLAKLFNCNPDPDDILRPPEFGEYGKEDPPSPGGGSGDSDPPDEKPPKERPPEEPYDPSVDIEVDVDAFKVYFDNDIYQVQLSYEHYDDPDDEDVLNRFGLNSRLYSKDPSDPNIPTPDSIDDSPPLSKVETLLTKELEDGTPVRDFHNLSFIGNASALFVGAQTSPTIYNIYLSYRRVFSFSQFILNRYGIPLSSMKLDKRESAAFYRNNKSLMDSIGPEPTLADFDKDRMFPKDASAYDGKNLYRFELGNRLVFVEDRPGGGPAFTINLTAQGSSQSQIEPTDQNFNERRSKEDRNVFVLPSVDVQAVEAYEEGVNQEREEERADGGTQGRQQRDDSQKGKRQEEPEEYQFEKGRSDDLNCYDRFIRTDPEVMALMDQDLMEQYYGFRKNRRFHAAFHSQTPEDFHRRLVFLNQLMYPGRAYPASTASNSAFGRSPITIMRIGDFFHSKVVVKSVNISYDDVLFDLNPEGMGVQPMVATVTMSGVLLGGQSLAGAIDRLQNAVSFNHYANSTFYGTGMYRKAREQEEVQKRLDENARSRSDKESNIKIRN